MDKTFLEELISKAWARSPKTTQAAFCISYVQTSKEAVEVVTVQVICSKTAEMLKTPLMVNVENCDNFTQFYQQYCESIEEVSVLTIVAPEKIHFMISAITTNCNFCSSTEIKELVNASEAINNLILKQITAYERLKNIERDIKAKERG